jgi:hypothetical protein
MRAPLISNAGGKAESILIRHNSKSLSHEVVLVSCRMIIEHSKGAIP